MLLKTKAEGCDPHLQGWARDVNGRDRDVSLPRRDRGVWPHQQRRDRDETFRFRDETETFVGLET